MTTNNQEEEIQTGECQMCYRQKNQNSVHQHKLSSIFGSGLIPQTHKKQMNSTTHVNAKLFLLSQMKNRAPCNMTATRTDVMRSIRNAIDIKLTQNSTRSCYWIVHIVQSNQQTSNNRNHQSSIMYHRCTTTQRYTSITIQIGFVCSLCCLSIKKKMF